MDPKFLRQTSNSNAEPLRFPKLTKQALTSEVLNKAKVAFKTSEVRKTSEVVQTLRSFRRSRQKLFAIFIFIL